jgi:hypothetical protein
MPRLCTKHRTAALPTPGRFPPCQSVQSVSHRTVALPRPRRFFCILHSTFCIHRASRGESWETRRTLDTLAPGITLRLPGAPPAFAGPHNITQAYGRRAEGSFPVFGPLWKAGKRRLAPGGGQKTARPPTYERFPRAWCSPPFTRQILKTLLLAAANLRHCRPGSLRYLQERGHRKRPPAHNPSEVGRGARGRAAR